MKAFFAVIFLTVAVILINYLTPFLEFLGSAKMLFITILIFIATLIAFKEI